MKRKPKRQREAEKQARRENYKCSGKKIHHGIRSAVAKTWDESKARRAGTKSFDPSPKQRPAPTDSQLDAMAKRIADVQGWSYGWVRRRKANAILGMAKKYL